MLRKLSHMAVPPAKPSFFRWQFSLRTLLVLMTLAAVGLVVLRWQWTVELSSEAGDPPQRGFSKITYRRNWNGKPAKHGVALQMWFGLHLGTEEHYANGELTTKRIFRNGEAAEFEIYKNGKTVTTFAAVPQHEITGTWTSTKQHGDEIVTERCAWRNAERHGLSTWTSSNGKVLQSAEFDHGRIVKWNGEPAAAALERWVKERVENKDFHKPLLTDLANKEAYFHWGQSRRGFLWASNEGFVVVHYGLKTVQFAEPTEWLPLYQGRRLAEVILEMALNDSGMLDHRYGAPCIVPICSSELNWQDPTNVAAIKFELGSRAALEWNERAGADFVITGWPAAQIKTISIHSDRAEDSEIKAIKFDTSAVDHLDPPPYMGPDVNAIPDYPRPLRDLLGHILYDAGYHCEQRGETIVVLPGSKP